MTEEVFEDELAADASGDDSFFFEDLLATHLQPSFDNNDIVDDERLYSREENKFVESFCGSKHKKLLSPEAEQQLLCILDRYKVKVSKVGLDHIPEREKDVARKAEHELVLRNIRYVIYIIKTYFPHVMEDGRFLDFQDILQEGIIGLIKGIRHFDASLGWRLTTYVGWWIRQNIGRAICDTEDIIRLPVHVHDAINKIYAAKQECYLLDNVPDPDIFDLAFRSGLNVSHVRRLMSLPKVFPDSFYSNAGEEEVSVIDSFAADTRYRPDSLCENAEIQCVVKKALESGKLKQIEVDVIKYRFGIGCSQELTLENIGDMYGVTRERIRQIEAKAIKSLRKQFVNQKLNC